MADLINNKFMIPHILFLSFQLQFTPFFLYDSPVILLMRQLIFFSSAGSIVSFLILVLCMLIKILNCKSKTGASVNANQGF